jgi:hypothetical protein
LVVVAGLAVRGRERLGLVQCRFKDLVSEGGIAVAGEEFGRGGFQRLDLLVCQSRSAFERLGPLHRRRDVVGPDALKIGLAVPGAGRGPCFGLGFGTLSHHRDRDNHCGNDYGERAC